MIEKWKKIKNFPYSVSSKGRVKRISASPGTRVGKILKPILSSNGYYEVFLCKDGKVTRFLIHDLVACHFIGKKPINYTVNHKDGIKLNNDVKNLEYLTYSKNMKHAYDTGLVKIKSGTKHHCSKLSIQDVKKIRKLYKTGKYTYIDLGKKFGVSDCTVSDIMNFKRHANII